MMSYLVYQNCR